MAPLKAVTPAKAGVRDKDALDSGVRPSDDHPVSASRDAAEDGQALAGGVLSPCVRNCCLDDENVCLGCFRTLKEICAWHEAPDSEKLAILVRCRSRYRGRFTPP